jgi:hypothetical protein
VAPPDGGIEGRRANGGIEGRRQRGGSAGAGERRHRGAARTGSCAVVAAYGGQVHTGDVCGQLTAYIAEKTTTEAGTAYPSAALPSLNGPGAARRAETAPARGRPPTRSPRPPTHQRRSDTNRRQLHTTDVCGQLTAYMAGKRPRRPVRPTSQPPYPAAVGRETGAAGGDGAGTRSATHPFAATSNASTALGHNPVPRCSRTIASALSRGIASR